MASHSKKVVSPTSEKIAAAAKAILDGELVVIPTETVYGLGANAFDASAVAKIFEAKKRPFFDPLICHIADKEMLSQVVENLSPAIQKLIDAFWPGPLTIVAQKTHKIPDIITSGLSTVAVRMPSHEVTRQLIKEAGVPIAAPSANLFGRLSPTLAEHTLPLEKHVHSILNGGRSEVGVESTIVRVNEGKLYILRPGGISAEEIAKVSGLEPILMQADSKLPDAPGQLPSHYAPHARVIIIEEGKYPKKIEENSALLAFRFEPPAGLFSPVEVLSPKGDLRIAASRFFEALHTLDDSTACCIYAEAVPELDLGAAIMNRLRKAAYTEE